MRLSKGLADFIAAHAISEPYRQSRVMDTHWLERWLRERGRSVSWWSLHNLATVGVLRPIAVLTDAVPSKARTRYIPVDPDDNSGRYLDLGCTVVAENITRPPFPQDLAPGTNRAMLWHPFQAWTIDQVVRRLDLSIGTEASLSDRSDYVRIVEMTQPKVAQGLAEFANAADLLDFHKVLGVLLAAEPLVISSVDNRIRLSGTPPDGTIDEYLAWRETADGGAVLTSTGASVQLLKEWHRKLALNAQLIDPLENWRTLVRYVPREQRLKLKGEALLAEEFYYAAEVLRRFLEQYHEVSDLFEEDDVGHGPQGPDFKQRVYGKPRTADFDRSVFRQVVRQYDLDPQPRLRWFVEGDTEKAFIARYAERLNIELVRSGVEVIDLHGLGGLESDRTRILLLLSRTEEVFAHVSIDYDMIERNPGILQTYAREGLLPAGYKIYDPDFVSVNFDLEELAEAASKFASEQGVGCTITAATIEREMLTSGGGVEKAIKRLWNNSKFYGSKGGIWGAALADLAYRQEPPETVRNSEGKRAIVAAFTTLMRGRTSNYKFTTEDTYVDDDGEVVRVNP